MPDQKPEPSSCVEENFSSRFHRHSFLSGAIFGLAITLICTITLNLIAPSLMSAALITKNKEASISKELSNQTLILQSLNSKIQNLNKVDTQQINSIKKAQINNSLNIIEKNYDLNCLAKSGKNNSFASLKLIEKLENTQIRTEIVKQINLCQKSDSKLDKFTEKQLASILNDPERLEILKGWGDWLWMAMVAAVGIFLAAND
ncbi:MAG TPA: hypothetical protein PLQ36_00900 [Candidatus Gracilibacteria bacterium]|mgnify:CR=1 FL=1|nr:hypothetical protein [Candidatus Gracilibacteria bacterium]